MSDLVKRLLDDVHEQREMGEPIDGQLVEEAARALTALEAECQQSMRDIDYERKRAEKAEAKCIEQANEITGLRNSYWEERKARLALEARCAELEKDMEEWCATKDVEISASFDAGHYRAMSEHATPWKVRAEKAEAELANLRDRIEREPVVKALEGIRRAIEKGLTENGSDQHRVKLTDGTYLEGQAAADWRNMLVAFRDIASSALASAPERVKAEPVAWRAFCDRSGGQMVHTIKSRLVEDADSLYGKNQWTLAALYASPPASVVTDEMAKALRALLDCPDIADNDHKDEETHAAERLSSRESRS